MAPTGIPWVFPAVYDRQDVLTTFEFSQTANMTERAYRGTVSQVMRVVLIIFLVTGGGMRVVRIIFLVTGGGTLWVVTVSHRQVYSWRVFVLCFSNAAI